MKPLLLDTTAAIALGETAGRDDLLGLVATLGHHLEVPRQVLDEFNVKRQGELSPHLGPIVVDESVLKQIQTRYPVLGAGELAVLARATELAGQAVCILDDRQARHAAGILGFEVKGTWALLVDLVEQGLLSEEELENVVANLRAGGFRLPDDAHLAEARRVRNL